MENQALYKDVWVITESLSGKILPITFELLSLGRKLAEEAGEKLIAVLPGFENEAIASELLHYGTDHVVCLSHPKLAHYRQEYYTAAITALLKHQSPGIVLAPATIYGREYIPRVAARLHTGLLKDFIKLELDMTCKKLVAYSPAYDGKRISKYMITVDGPQIAVIREGIGAKAVRSEQITGTMEKFIPDLSEITTNVAQIRETCEAEEIGLTKSKMIAAGGRGLKKEGFLLLEKLAERLGGKIGCTRPCVDVGWTRPDRQIGQTGVTVKPKLYLAFGISGAVQHVSGMKDSECIVGINTNPKAAIFRYCDYGIEGDAVKILEYLLEKLDIPEKCD